MRLKVILLTGLCLLLTGCGQISQVDEDLAEKDRTIAQLENRIDQLETQIKQLEDELDGLENYRSSTESFIRSSISVLPSESLNAMAQLDWSYEILINESPLPEDNTVLLSDRSFTFTISERKNPDSILPVDISEMGKISGSIFSNHIQFPTTMPSDVLGDDTNLVSSATYVFEELEPGSTLQFEFSQELQQRLGISTNVLNVIVPDLPAENPDAE